MSTTARLLLAEIAERFNQGDFSDTLVDSTTFNLLKAHCEPNFSEFGYKVKRLPQAKRLPELTQLDRKTMMIEYKGYIGMIEIKEAKALTREKQYA